MNPSVVGAAIAATVYTCTKAERELLDELNRPAQIIDVPRAPTRRDELELTLVAGAAQTLAVSPWKAKQIAAGIQEVLDVLYPARTDPVAPPYPALDPTVSRAEAVALLDPPVREASPEAPDFLAGKTACDLSADKGCESCQ